jgi:4-diphosphocytidyl-2-C-methyl-D-erythritol kinase
MIIFPNCKINIGLYITAKRPDGFHDIETVFYPINNFYDCLEIVEARQFSCTTSGVALEIPQEKNIVVKAFRLLQQDFSLTNIQIHLHKNIPHGAGLGGGSADASFMLQLCNTFFDLQLNQTQLLNYANKLGSDCAFFLQNTPCLGLGRGEILTPIAITLHGYYICLVKPNIYISTADAFASIMPGANPISLADAISQPIDTWQHSISNQFESGIFTKHPQLQNMKETLLNTGAIYAAMSGTGSTVYGIFSNKKQITIADSQVFWMAL